MNVSGSFCVRCDRCSLLPQTSLRTSRRTSEASVGATSEGSYSTGDSVCCQQQHWSPNSRGGLKWCAGKVIPLYLPPKYPYFLLKSEHYTRLSSLMNKNQQLVLTNQRVFVGNCLKIKKNNLNHPAIISSEQKFFLIKEENDFPNLPEMLKVRWKWWQEWQQIAIAVEQGYSARKIVHLPVDPFRRNHMDEVLHSRVTHSSLESCEHTPNSINQGKKADILSSPLLKSQGICWGLLCDPTCWTSCIRRRLR